MDLPKTYTDQNETGCCPVPNVKEWDKRKVTFKDKHFIRMYTKSFMYVPLNMAKIMTELSEAAQKSGFAMPVQDAMILSREISPWKAEQLYAVIQPVEDADNVTLNGIFLSRVFEGPYKDAGKWHKTLIEYAKEQGYDAKNIYFFYTTCPKCAKHYGNNYIVGLVEVA